MLAGAAPVPVIFDTDIGNDIDDVLALAMLHALDARAECRLIGVTLTNPADSIPRFTHLLNRFYGRTDLPVGVSQAKRTTGANRKYPDATLAEMPGAPSTGPTIPAVPLLRKLLAQSQEKVVIVQVGFSDNLSVLLDSKADEYSSLDGRALVSAKVSLLSIMAGDFDTGKPEYNVRIDVPSARKVITGWPTPVVLSGWEVGDAIRYPAASIERDYSYVRQHPVAIAYGHYQKMPYSRSTYDLTSVLYAVRPEAGYFELSAPGRVDVADDGKTTFTADPAGSRRYLIVKPAERARIVEAMTLLSSQPPATSSEPSRTPGGRGKR
jgi:inosine-uridine nucleoside N-ribohydrolase